MGEQSKLRGILPVAIGALLIVSGAAFGGAMPVTASIVTVTATSGDHSATFNEVFPVSDINGVCSWALPSPVALSDGAVTLGTVTNLEVGFNADPEVDLGFAVKNMSSSAVTFSITAGTISFMPITDGEALAGASVTLTAGTGSAPGASITGLFANGATYQARYSTHGIINTATAYASLTPSFSFTSGLTDSASEVYPGDGNPAVLGGTVYMMESEYKFILSAGDQASGTSIFMITPEPASLIFLGLGACFAIRRR